MLLAAMLGASVCAYPRNCVKLARGDLLLRKCPYTASLRGRISTKF
jgi:hypothetical protein